MKTQLCTGNKGTVDGGGQGASLAGATTALNAATEKLKTAASALPAPRGTSAEQEREVVGLYLTPRAPDGSGGQLVKVIKEGPAPERQFMEPAPYFKQRRTE